MREWILLGFFGGKTFCILHLPKGKIHRSWKEAEPLVLGPLPEECGNGHLLLFLMLSSSFDCNVEPSPPGLAGVAPRALKSGLGHLQPLVLLFCSITYRFVPQSIYFLLISDITKRWTSARFTEGA